MDDLTKHVNISESENKEIIETLKEWVAINTHCSNLSGLDTFISKLETKFASLGGTTKRIKLPDYPFIDENGDSHYKPVGNALCTQKRPDAPLQILLSGHQDTVFEIDSPFQHATQLDENRLGGPGVADMKGGILILHKSLELLERSPFAINIGWKVLLTPDEEIGSPSSEECIFKAAKEAHIGLVFEPAFPDGNLVSARKGSSCFVIVAKGKRAHVGRDFSQGRSAIAALAHFIMGAHALNQVHPTVTLNIGKITGGEASNIVPALASCVINIRTNSQEELNFIANQLQQLANDSPSAAHPSNDGISIEVHPLSSRGPKLITPQTEDLFQAIQKCAKALSIHLEWKPTGGVCDGNILAQAGLPCVDTLGAVGGGLHTYDEYIEIKSLSERAQLTALLLISLASKPDVIQKWSRRNER